MSEEQGNEENANRRELQDRIASRSRKIGMLMQSSRFPDAKDKIRKDFKRREKLVQMRSKIRARRSSGGA